MVTELLEVDAIKGQKIDVLKYGFILSQNKGDMFFYNRRVKDILIELSIATNIYSLDYTLHDERVNVANRYKVEYQEQLDFLILNGRIGWLFQPQPMSCPV